MILGAAIRQRLGHILREQEKQAITVQIILARRGLCRHLLLYLLDRFAERRGQPFAQRVNITDNHALSLYKTAFHFIVLYE
ncbi:hypothetical protein BN136_3247 [Cronobacter universalis NCTC 9529]|nr:hypothetical protein BN136_3247 [Cronobacter universalis NCTC 9529]